MKTKAILLMVGGAFILAALPACETERTTTTTTTEETTVQHPVPATTETRTVRTY